MFSDHKYIGQSGIAVGK